MSRFICLGAAVLAASVSLGFSGCCSTGSGCGGGGGAIMGFVDNFMQKQVACMQERVWARRAFHLRYGHCERVHAAHFRDGFIAGYCNVCSGSGSDAPALPPEKYWGFQYRNQEGSQMQTAWFQGFESGAGSARTDGTGSFQEIQISRQLEQAMMAANELEDYHGGIQREEIVNTPQIVGSGLQGAAQANGAFVTEHGSNMPLPMTNTPLAQPIAVPSFQTGTTIVNTPLPIQSTPPVPVVPGNSQK